MKIAITLMAFLLAASPAHAGSRADDAMCSELNSFLASVQPDEKRAVTLHTFWGVRTEGDRIVMASKRCDHDDYDPGKKLCAYLMERASMEFAGSNVKRALNCLLPSPGLPDELQISGGSFSTTYGSPDRGALVDIDLSPDGASEGLALRIAADGY